MSGEQIKAILKADGVNYCRLAVLMGYASDQQLHSVLKAKDVKSGVIEKIAKATGKTVAYYYNEDPGELEYLRRANKRLWEELYFLAKR